MIGNLRLLWFLPFATGCSAVAASGPVTVPQPTVHVYQGTLRLVFADGVEAGRLDQADGQCLGMSLPKKDVNRLRASGPRIATVRGLLFEAPNDIEVATIRVNGRQVGFRQCNNKYVFVRRSGDISWEAR